MPDQTPTLSVPDGPDPAPGPTVLAADAGPGGADDPGPVPGYVIIGEAGRGGIGVVYRALDPAVNRQVAVKVLQPRYRASPAAVRRFVEEGQVTGQLQHPGVPAVHQIGTLPDGSPFLAMKLIKGDTLADRLADPARDTGRLVADFLQICQAVGYAHSRGVIHRDLKPANVMVGQFGEVQVMDWGLAKVLGAPAPAAAAEPAVAETRNTFVETDRASDPDSRTQAGSVLGTPAYMSPEQAGGESDRLDERADVFGLGAVLCEILTGEPPYQGKTSEAVRLKAVRGQLDEAFARLDRCGADPELVRLCRQCLAPERDDRPRDAGAVAAAVAAHLAAVEDRLRRAERDRAAAVVRAAEQRKRRRTQRALLLSVGLLVLGAGAVAWWADRQAGERRADELRREIADRKRADEDARRDEAVRQRLARNAQAVGLHLGQTEDALRADDAGAAAGSLDLARRGLAEGGADHLRPRFDRCAAELALLRDLDRADDLRWAYEKDRLRTTEAVAETVAVFRRFGVVPGETPPGEAARRVNESLVRDRLLTALDTWLAHGGPPALVAVLHAADPDPYRDAVRAALPDPKRLAEAAARPEALDQPVRFAVVLGEHALLPDDRREQILTRAVLHRPGHFRALMAVAAVGSFADEARAERRAGWYRAALAVRPTNVAALNNLGHALFVKGDSDGAVAVLSEAARLHPDRTPSVYFNLAYAYLGRGEFEEARAAFAAAARLDPANRTYPGYVRTAEGLIKRFGDTRARIADVAAGRAEPRDPADALALADLAEQPFQRRYALAVELTEKAFAAEPARATAPGRARFAGARAAVLAAAGRDPSRPAPGTAERDRLNGLALPWLRVELAHMAAAAKEPRTWPQVNAAASALKADPNLASVRDPAALVALPPDRRKAWEEFWADVDAMIAATPSPRPGPPPPKK